MEIDVPVSSIDTAVRRARRLLDDAGASLAGKRVLALCSGGADSVALVAVLDRLPRGARPRELHVAWCDHGLRTDVAAERAAAEAVADAAGAPFHELRAESDLRAEPGGVEAAARTWRLAVAGQLAIELGCERIATGHTADDQLEQALLTLVGVTGRAGAPHAMPVERDLAGDVRLVRPLLSTTRAQVEELLAEAGLAWADDPTNANPDAHVRNAIRHTVVPPLLAASDGAGAALVRAAERARDEHDAARPLAAALLDAWATTDLLDVRVLVDLPGPARRELLAEWLRRAGLGRSLDARTVSAVDQLAVHPGRAACSRLDVGGGACVRRDGYDLLLTRSSSGGSPP